MTDYNGKTLQREGFTLRVSVKQDEYGEADWLGTFTSEWQEGALDHHRKSCYGTRDHHRWFVPAISVSDHRKGLSDLGFAKGVAEEMARSYVEENYQRADSFGHEWSIVVVTVTASRRGVELGSAAVGGVESDGDEAYFDEVIEDLIDQALGEAQDALDDLVSSVHPLDHLAKCAE